MFAFSWSLSPRLRGLPGDAGVGAGSAPTVPGTTVLAQHRPRPRSRRRRCPCRRSGCDVRHRAGLVDVDHDRLEHWPAGERPLLELRDRRPHRGRPTFGALTTTLAGSPARGRPAACGCRSGSIASDSGKRLGPGAREVQLERRHGHCQQQPAREDRREHRPAQDAVDDRAPDPAFAVAARSRPTNGTRPLSTLSPSRESRAGSTVSEPSTATATTSIVATPKRREPLVAGQEHPGHRDDHRQARRSARSGRRSRPRPRERLLAPPGSAFLSFALEVEHRVVDADRKPDQQHHPPTPPWSIGRTWLGSADQARTSRRPRSARAGAGCPRRRERRRRSRG